MSESAPVHDHDPDADPDDWTWGAGVYGPLKAGAEAAGRREFGDAFLVVRPGVMLGPHEYGGRLTWWLDRCRRGGRILAPGRPSDLVRPVDVRDVAAFILALVEGSNHGVFNVAGPPGRDTMGGFLESCLDSTSSDGFLDWVSSTWLVDQGVRQWSELPMWRTAPGTWAIDTTTAVAAGLTSRPLSQIVADTWSWLRSGGRPVEDDRQALHGLGPDREVALLAAWDENLRTGRQR